MGGLVLKEDAEILSKGLRIVLPLVGAAASTPAPGASAVEATVEMTDLAKELRAEAGDATSAEDVAARWADLGARRNLFDRALFGRLSLDGAQVPVADYLIACYAAVTTLRSRKGSSATEDLAEIFSYVTDLCVSYCAMALLNPDSFQQPADAQTEGVLRLLGPLRADSLPSGFLTRLVARLQEDGDLPNFAQPIFHQLWVEVGPPSLSLSLSLPPSPSLSLALSLSSLFRSHSQIPSCFPLPLPPPCTLSCLPLSVTRSPICLATPD